MYCKGIPFSEAYKQIGEQIESGKFQPEKKVKHSHEGSIGNLCLEKISGYKKDNQLKILVLKKLKKPLDNYWNSLLSA